MKKSIKITLGIIIGIILAAVIFAKINRITPLAWDHKQVNQAAFSKVAINGYDPVSYVENMQAAKGNESISHEYKDALWLFASEENKAKFIEQPEKYIPQFGGYCALAISHGVTANTNPEVFAVIDDKLYLFDSESIKQDWLANYDENKAQCEKNWR